MKTRITLFVLVLLNMLACTKENTGIPLPEHPRPDRERKDWINLNGPWAFTFDEGKAMAVLRNGDLGAMDQQITVPFSWGTELSGVEDSSALPHKNFHAHEKQFLPPRTRPKDIGWYARQIKIPSKWRDKRVFLIVGAADYESKVWLNGRELGEHRGGYTPFEIELDGAVAGEAQCLMIRVDDTWSKTRLYGKQEYGDVRGIWQTVYLEARPKQYIESIHFTPDIKESCVRVHVQLDQAAAEGETFRLHFRTGRQADFEAPFNGSDEADFIVPIKDQHLWSLDDPFLYEVTASLKSGDCLDTYFGQREISTAVLPGTDYPYIALNGKPVYLQLTLDQSYYPGSHYTFPSDEVMKNEILLSKKLGLSGNRIHIKAEMPRKLYWADRLGLLIMADIPHFWGRPVPESRADWEHCLRQQVSRDYNHPSIFAWVCFNETWGLTDTADVYQPETQEWVRQMYLLAKDLDKSRLVEDMSPCRHDHVQTDINSWHGYRPGYEWERTIAMNCDSTYRGSSYNYIGGNVQGDEPMMNSECGNVWGYYASTGDCDFSWDYHLMLNAFRRHPRCAGWLYTEHHDVIKEWNGYVRFDRSPKYDGLEELVPGMGLKDLHSLYYVSPDCPLYQVVPGGSRQQIPYYLSVMTDKVEEPFTMRTELVRYGSLGEVETVSESEQELVLTPWQNGPAGSLTAQMPEKCGLYLLRIVLNKGHQTVHRNFVAFRVKDAPATVPEDCRVVTFQPASYTKAEWSVKSSAVLDSLKVNGLGYGFFEYTVTLPEDLSTDRVKDAELIFEASSRPVMGRDLPDQPSPGYEDPNYDPSRNNNAYHMTDNQLNPSAVEVLVNGQRIGLQTLSDDPADHRGILSWGAQLQDLHLREAGTYGQIVRMKMPTSVLKGQRQLTIRLGVPEESGAGGLAIYSQDFGRFPLDPTLIFKLEK